MSRRDHLRPQPAQMVFRRPRAEGGDPRLQPRRGARPGRRQWRRQVDADQHPVGRPPGRPGRDPGRGKAGPHRQAARRDGSRHRDDLPVQFHGADHVDRQEPVHRPRADCASRSAASALLDQTKMAQRKHPRHRRCRLAPALARRAGGRAVRRPAAGRRHRAGHAFQVEGDDPRRADQPSLGQGDEEGDRLRAQPEGARASPASSSATTCTMCSNAATASSRWRAARWCWTSGSRTTSIDEVARRFVAVAE